MGRDLGGGGVPMEKALTKAECESMRLFLSALVTYKRKYPKTKPGNFMKVCNKMAKEGNDWLRTTTHLL